MTKVLSGTCPVCNKSFNFDIDEAIIENAEFFPVVFSTAHCDQAILCYVDSSYSIRMIETAYLPSTSNSSGSNQQESGHLEGKLLDVSTLSKEKRTILECTLAKDNFKNQKFPNLIEKQVIFQIMKHGNLTLERLIQELKLVEKALQVEVTRTFLNPIIEKYIKLGILKQSEI